MPGIHVVLWGRFNGVCPGIVWWHIFCPSEVVNIFMGECPGRLIAFVSVCLKTFMNFNFFFFWNIQTNRGVARRGVSVSQKPSHRDQSPPLSTHKWNDTVYRGLRRASILSPGQPPPPPRAPLSPPYRAPPHFLTVLFISMTPGDNIPGQYSGGGSLCQRHLTLFY